VGDLRDAEAAERLEETAPDEFLRRREFLQRTAMAAGLAATMGTVLPADTIVAEAARRQRRVRLPSPRNMPVDTFVVLMMENRSFDHYLGWLPGADGRQAGLQYTDDNGQVHETRRLAPDWQGCGHPDPDHSRAGGVVQLNGGACDGFLRSGDNDEFAISYYQEGDLGFIQDAAKAFTTYDRFFCSLMASTLPNREYMWAAQSYGLYDNDLPPQTEHTVGFPWETTLFAALERAGVSCRYFFNDVPVSALWGQEGLQRSGSIAEYYARCASGTLPAVSYVDPNFAGSVGEGPGLSGDEHPHGDVRTGQAFMSDVVHAFMESPQWERGALFITYDEWGGFFDHVAPPRVPDMRNDPDINKDFGLMGFRLPTVCVSPYVRRGEVSHDSYGFESIIKMIRYRFGIDPLNRRDAYARNIARSFDWRSDPRLDLPPLPDPATVVSLPCPGNPDGDSARVSEHDLYELYTSGYLESLGFDFRPASADTTFREPSRMTQSFRPPGAHPLR
jgi:phospholipase C